MLFKHKHLLEEMRKSGCPGIAEVLSMKTVGSGGSIRAVWAPDEDLTTNWTDCWMKLRVRPNDRAEAPFEATVLTRIQTFKFMGSTVPVWYDPNDHSKVVVDYEADVQAEMHSLVEVQHSLADNDRMSHRYDSQPGLAWTPVGGVLLPVQAMTKPGKGRLAVTGQLGPLLNESAQVAWAYVQGNAARLVPAMAGEWFARHDIQIDQAYGNVPRSATPEDGASAGIAVAAALASLLSGRIVRPETAVMGSLAPTGELLPVRAFKDKVVAAKRDFAQRVVAPAGNEQDSRQIGERQREGLEFVFAANVNEAVRAALAKHPIKGYALPV
jgi:ATP-dependent Lon protease